MIKELEDGRFQNYFALAMYGKTIVFVDAPDNLHVMHGTRH